MIKWLLKLFNRNPTIYWGYSDLIIEWVDRPDLPDTHNYIHYFEKGNKRWVTYSYGMGCNEREDGHRYKKFELNWIHNRRVGPGYVQTYKPEENRLRNLGQQKAEVIPFKLLKGGKDDTSSN